MLESQLLGNSTRGVGELAQLGRHPRQFATASADAERAFIERPQVARRQRLLDRLQRCSRAVTIVGSDDAELALQFAYLKRERMWIGAVQQHLVPPDIFRMRHRLALAEVIAAIVRQGVAATEQTVRGKIQSSVPAAEHAHFTALVLAEFATLHMGNAVRFGFIERALALANARTRP